MAIQTLNTIKNWFKTSLKPSQQQFWDTWDSFRHKYEKVPVNDVEGIDELLNTKADKTSLNEHLNDKNAHAPQINTDWNSESGFSQLLNKPEFKTINGKSVLGDGDITIEEGGLQNLDQTLANGNETDQTALFKGSEDQDIFENTIKGKQIEIKHSNLNLPDKIETLSLKSDLIEIAKLNTGETTALFAEGIGFGNSNSNHYSVLGMNPNTTANYSNVLMPFFSEEGQTKTLATTEDFKTINGQSIIGEGDIDSTPTLQQILDSGNQTYLTALFRRGEDEDIYENTIGAKQIEIKHSNDYTPDRNEMVSLKSDIIEIAKLNTGETTALLANGVGFGNSNTNNYSTLEMNPATTANYSNVLMPPITEEGQTKTLATTGDFKTINGESILGKGDITLESNNQSGTPNAISKFDSSGEKLEDSNISDNGSRILMNTSIEIDSQEEGKAGLKFSNLKNESKTVSEIVFDQDVFPTAGIDETAYFPFGNVVKKVNLDKSIIDYFSFPEGYYISEIIAGPKSGDLFLTCYDGTLYNLVKFDNTGVLSVLKSSSNNLYSIAIDKNDSVYVQEFGSTAIFKIDSSTLSEDSYYTGGLSLYFLGFDQELNGYFIDYNARNEIYKINESGLVTNFITLDFSINHGCVKADGSLYITPSNYDDKNIYLVDKNGTNVIIFASADYNLHEPCLSEDEYLYVHNNNYDNGLVYRISPQGELSIFGSAGKSPRYMTVTKSGIVYTSNSGSYNLIKISVQKDIKLLTLDKDGNVIFSNREVTVKSDFKTINGESILGDGDINSTPTLQQVMDEGSMAKSLMSLQDPNGTNNYFFFSGNYTAFTDANMSKQTRMHEDHLFIYDSPKGGNMNIDVSGLRNNNFATGGNGSSSLNFLASALGDSVLNVPNTGATNVIPVEVNGVKADENGKITIPTEGRAQDLKSVLDAGAVAILNRPPETEDTNSLEIEFNPNGVYYSQRNGNGVNIGLNVANSNLGFYGSRDIRDSETDEFLGYSDISVMLPIPRDEISAISYTYSTAKPSGTYTIATTSDFKTINGESIVGEGNISLSNDNVLHKTGNESKEGDLYITGNLGVSQYLGLTGNIEITDMDTFPGPPETTIILDKSGDLTAKNFIGRSIVSYTGEFSSVKIGTSASSENKLEVGGTISSNGIKIGASNTESSDTIFVNTPIGSQKTITGNTIQIAGATGDYFLETFRYNASDYGMQRITFTSTASAGRFFIRTLTAGAWSTWIEK